MPANMDTVIVVLLLLLLVGISNALVRIVPLPLPLLQIALGATLAAVPGLGVRISLDPEIFLFLFIPPLLFSDGWRIPKREFFHNRRAILMLAFGLVFFTVFGAGYFIHWLIPVIPLPVAFALAAVLSPTDTVAVMVISGRATMPRRLKSILQGESLLNDASGLVAFKFALVAAMTGVFSLKSAAVDFVFIAVSGTLIGVALTVIVDRVRHYLTVWRGATPGAYIILTLLLPFTAYKLADMAGGSGILAAVGAGIALNFTAFSKDSTLELRIQNATLWGMIEMAFNGTIFILLGLQLPEILGNVAFDAAQAGVSSPWWLLVYVLAITGVLFALRFLWVWVSFKLTLLRAVFSKRANPDRPVVSIRVILASMFAGVRGAITLAGVLSIPLLMPDGSVFPARELLVFLASGVILVSLLAGSFGLPFVLRNLRMPADESEAIEERTTRRLTAEAAIRALQIAAATPKPEGQITSNVNKDLCGRVSVLYREKLDRVSDNEELKTSARHACSAEQSLRLMAIRAERAELFQLYETRKISNHTLDVLLNELDMTEAALLGTNIGHL